MKKIIIFILAILLVITGCTKDNETNKIKIVSTIFPGYDFARAVGGDNVELKMLVSPGSEVHAYDPTPKDIIAIEESDIFVYVGGESEKWVEEILQNLSDHTKVIKLMDLVDVKEEETVEGMEEEHDEHETNIDAGEYDEHVWTSPVNAIKMVQAIENKLVEVDNVNKSYYENNANNYIDALNEINSEFNNIVANAKRTEVVFADRFPLRYFVDEYGLNYRAAFPGCSSDTEASASTIAYLIDYVNNNDISVVFYIELSNQKLADILVEDTNAKKLEFQSGHNITKEEFDEGITYIDLMKENIKNLKEALN